MFIGIYARNVRGLTLNNVRLEVKSPDLRPAIVFDQVSDADINGFSAQGNLQAASLLRFINAPDVLMTGSLVLTPAALFLKLEGASSEGIIIDGGSLSKAGTLVSYAGWATDKTVKIRTL